MSPKWIAILMAAFFMAGCGTVQTTGSSTSAYENDFMTHNIESDEE